MNGELFGVGRKFILAILILVAATVLLALGNLAVANWQTIVTWLMGLYVGGNAMDKGLTAIGKGIGTRRTDPKGK